MNKRIFFIAALILLPLSAYAALQDQTAVLTFAKGTVQYRLLGGETWKDARVNQPLEPFWQIQTGPDSKAEIAFDTGDVVRLGPSSMITLRRMKKDPVTMARHTKFQLPFGEARADVKSLDPKISAFRSSTPIATAAVKGTDFGVSHLAGKSAINVFSGVVEGLGQAGLPQLIETGKSMFVEPKVAPPPPQPTPKEELKKWEEIEKDFPIKKGEVPPVPGIGVPGGPGPGREPNLTNFLIGGRDPRVTAGKVSLSQLDRIEGMVVVTGTVDTGEGPPVKVVEVSLDDGSTWKAAEGTDIWTFRFAPEAGQPYRLKVKVVDQKDGAAETRPFEVIYREIAAFEVISPARNGGTNQRSPTFQWASMTEIPAGITLTEYEVYVDGQLVEKVSPDQTSSQPRLNLGEGPHNWYVVAKDQQGGSYATLPEAPFVVDSVPPDAPDFEANFLFPDEAYSRDSTVKLKPAKDNPGGSGIAGYEYQIGGTRGKWLPVRGGPAGTSFKVTVSPNTSVYVRSVDKAGNVSSASSILAR